MSRNEPYIKALYDARDRLLAQNTNGLNKAILSAYVSRVRDILQIINSGSITADNAQMLLNELRSSLKTWHGSIEDLTKIYSIRTIDGVGASHREFVKGLASEYSTELTLSMTGFRSDAFQAMFVRRGLGSVRTFKTLNNWKAYGEPTIQSIEDLLTKGIADGRNMRALTDEIADSLALGSGKLKNVLKGVGSDFDLNELRMNPSTDVRRMVNRLFSDARRIAVTEQLNAYHEGNRIASINNPVIKALKWQTSGRHDGLYSSPDICDVYENGDFHGLGEGVYYPETIPVKPHPHCACSTLTVLREPSEWTKPKESPTDARTARQNEIRSILEQRKTAKSRSITPKFVETVTAQTNRDHARAKQEAA